MRTSNATDLSKKQFTPQSWDRFENAKQEGHEIVVLTDFSGRGSKRGEKKTPLTFRAAFTENNLVTRGASEAFAALGYIIVNMKL